MVNSINPVGMYNPYYPYYPQYNTNFNSQKTMPVKRIMASQGAKFGPQKINKDIFVKSDKLPEIFPGAKVKKFAPNQRKTKRDSVIEQEKIHIAKPVTDRTKYNTEQLRSIGVPEREVKKYLRADGHVNDEGKKLLKEHGKSYK